MNSEKFYDAFENINDELLLSAAEEPAKRKTLPFGKIKWSVLAACVALFVAVPAVAAVFDIELSFFEGGWGAQTEAYIPIEEFSEEVRKAAEEQKPEAAIYIMGSLSEAEEFLGIDFPENELLERRSPRGVHYNYINAEGEEVTEEWVCCSVDVVKDENGMLVSTSAKAYFLGNISVTYIADAVKDEWGTGISRHQKGSASEKEIYTNPAGIDFRIVQNVSGHGCDFFAYATINRMLVSVNYYTSYLTENGYSDIVLKRILDGYVQ